MAEGYKKRDIQRNVQKVHLGASVSTIDLDGTTTTTVVEIGFPAEKVTLVTTGSLAANVTPRIGGAAAHTPIAATTTAGTTTTTNMFSSLLVTRTAGSGKLLILAK